MKTKQINKYKIIQWFKVDDKIIKSQRSTNDRELAFDMYEQGIKAKFYRGITLMRTRGFKK